MLENLKEALNEQLKEDIKYFQKHGIKSAMLQRAMNVCGYDDEDVIEMRLK